MGNSGGGGGGGGAAETVSPEDAAIIVPAAQSFMKDCGDCVAPGFDFTAKTVAVSGSDIQERDKWLSVMHDEHGGSEHDAFADVQKRCEWAEPRVTVDIAVMKFWQVNKLAPPMRNVWDGFADTCGNPPNPAVKAFVGKIKAVRFKVAPHWPDNCDSGQCGYEFSYDAASGVLDVGVHNHPVNIGPLMDAWLKQQT